jgi:hypothetical protein
MRLSVPAQGTITHRPQLAEIDTALESSTSEVVSLAALMPPLVLVAASVALGLVTARASRHVMHDGPRPLPRVFVLWLLGGLGGAHRFYCGHRRSGWMYMLSLGGCGVGWLMDLGRLRSLAESGAMASVSPNFEPVAVFGQGEVGRGGSGGPRAASIRQVAPAAPPFVALVHENSGPWFAEADEGDREVDCATPPPRRQLDLAWASPVPQGPPMLALPS